MQADLPFYESPEDALRAAVQALGGSKKVGIMLWPDKGVDNASRLLMDCLNTSRAEKLDMSQVMRVLAMAKEAGCHTPFSWMASVIGYDITPITQAEEVDRLTTVVEQSSKTLAAALTMLERLKNSNITHLNRA